MLKKVLLGLGALILVILIVAAIQPAEFRVERSLVINAPASLIFDRVNNLHLWQAWSPWAAKDPQAVLSYSGPTIGQGASFTWSGNREVGSGAMTILESQPGKQVVIRLDFKSPFTETSQASFTFQPEGTGTKVTWAMWGRHAFPSKVLGFLIGCERMIGADFEKGLASLKKLTEPS